MCAPPPTVARSFPHTIVLDDKLYVMAGMMYDNEKARGNFHWMEVFDPKLGTWKTLTNPPVEISTHAMVSSYGDPNGMFLTYDVAADFWTVLDRPIRKLFVGGSCELPSKRAPHPMVDGTLYWVKFEECNDLHAYNLDNEECFEGKLNLLQEVFGKREYLFRNSMLGAHDTFDSSPLACLLSMSLSSLVPQSQTWYPFGYGLNLLRLAFSCFFFFFLLYCCTRQGQMLL
ncbi:hypothetical protein ACB092_07G185700 [Castanea dentata]